MVRKVILESDAIRLYLHEDRGIVEHELLKYPGVEALEAALTSGLELIRNHRATKWLSDDRLGGALPMSHHEWARDVWGPRAARAGWRQWALIPPKKVLGATNMDRLVVVFGALGVKVRVCESPVHAMRWLSM